MRTARMLGQAMLLGSVVSGVSCGQSETPPRVAPAADRALAETGAGSVYLVGAGDVGDEAHRSGDTHALIRRIFQSLGGASCPGGNCASEPDGGAARARVIVPGDVVYPNGTTEDFANHYAPTWGRLVRNSWPALGNHEYADYTRPDANGYFDFFAGAIPGLPEASPAPLNRPNGWYAYDWGQWTVVVLNSSCNVVDCAGQDAWLRTVLAASVANEPAGAPKCQLVVAHHPRFSDCLPASEGGSCPGSGDAGGAGKKNNPLEKHLWDTMYDYGVDVLVSGHDHGYQRFPRFNKSDPPVQDNQGIRQFVVGSGGKDLYGFNRAPLAARIVQGYNTFGVVAFELRPASYRSAFRPANTPGDPEWDVNETECHGSNVPIVALRSEDGSGLYQGCYEDREDRALPDNLAIGAITPASCRSLCAGAGKPLAGVQNGNECWCGTTDPANASPPYALTEGQCTTPCSGDSTVACGGGWRNSVYRSR